MKAIGDQWQMIEYEIKMFYATYKKFFTRSTYGRLPMCSKMHWKKALSNIQESCVMYFLVEQSIQMILHLHIFY